MSVRTLRSDGRDSETRADHSLGGLATRGMAGDGGDEVVPLERIQLDIRRRAHRGSARHVAQERDLAEVRAWALTPRWLLVDEHVDLSDADDVEAVSVVPAADDLLAFRRLDGHKTGCELLQHRRRERREDR